MLVVFIIVRMGLWLTICLHMYSQLYSIILLTMPSSVNYFNIQNWLRGGEIGKIHDFFATSVDYLCLRRKTLKTNKIVRFCKNKARKDVNKKSIKKDDMLCENIVLDLSIFSGVLPYFL